MTENGRPQAPLETDEPAPGVRVVRLNRPARLNALSPDLVGALHRELDALALDQECRVVVLTGAGRGFCAGLDLIEHDGGHADPNLLTVQQRMRRQKGLADLVLKIRGLPQAVIAAVNGPAAGGGLALALGADIRVAGRSASFKSSFVSIGLSGCDIGVSWLLPRLVGASRAFELLLSGRLVDAEEADRLGLLARLVDDDDLLPHALRVAGAIAANSPMGVRMTKEVMWAQLEVGSLPAGMALENTTQVATTFTADHGEAVDAYLARRPAVFSDR